MPELQHWTIADFLANAARQFGDAPAIQYSRITWTYRDLERISDRLAAGLLSQGVTHGTHVALLAEPGLFSIAMFYAVQKIGAVAVMICTTLTTKEFAFQLELSEAEVNEALDAVCAPVSLFDPVYTDGGDPLTVPE